MRNHAEFLLHPAAVDHMTEREEIRRRSCKGTLRFLRPTFHSAIEWHVYECQDCHTEVFTVEGRCHRWNYDNPTVSAGMTSQT